MKATWEKVFEYASMPVHGTMSRRLRKGVSIQVNEGKIYENALIFMGDNFIRVTEDGGTEQNINTYYDFEKLGSVRTYSPKS